MADRKANIDLLRVISAAAIVTLHSVTAPMGNASSPIPLLTEQILTVIHSDPVGRSRVFHYHRLLPTFKTGV